MLGIMKTGQVAQEYFTGANMLLLAAMGVAAAAQVLNDYYRQTSLGSIVFHVSPNN